MAPQQSVIRASGPSQGYDANYLQNLASGIGGLFNGQQKGAVTNINPLGNLSEISPASGMEGNAPNSGAPLSWLQQALNGAGAAAPATTVPAVTPVKPVAPRTTNGPYGKFGS